MAETAVLFGQQRGLARDYWLAAMAPATNSKAAVG